jgi:putative redox protein
VKVVARRRSGYTHDVEIEGGHTLVIDEPVGAGGGDQGPSPTRTLGAALAACTAITCEMYANRKGWEVGALEVDVEIDYDEASGSASGFEVTLRVPVALAEEQQERLLAIAGKCPVHRIIAGETPVEIVDRIECQLPAG